MFTIKMQRRDNTYEVHECASYELGRPEIGEEGWASEYLLRMECPSRPDGLSRLAVAIRPERHNCKHEGDENDDVVAAFVMNSNGKTVDVIRL